jgi:hypothetical protein
VLLGVDHIGAGVANVTAAGELYGELSLTEAASDYTRPLPGLDRLTGHSAAVRGSWRSVSRISMVRVRSSPLTVCGRSRSRARSPSAVVASGTPTSPIQMGYACA